MVEVPCRVSPHTPQLSSSSPAGCPSRSHRSGAVSLDRWLLTPGATPTGHGRPGALGHDLRDVVITEPEVLADERAGDRPGCGLAAEPRFADAQDLCCLSWRVKQSYLISSNHYTYKLPFLPEILVVLSAALLSHHAVLAALTEEGNGPGW